jgi:hypothetical protein
LSACATKKPGWKEDNMAGDKGDGEGRTLSRRPERSREMQGNEPRITGYFQRVSRKLLATEGLAAAPLSPVEAQRRVKASHSQDTSARMGTIYWHWERRIHHFITRHEPTVQRLSEMLPGLITWGFILIPFLLARRAPIIPLLIAILFQVYWLYRGLGMLVYGGIGYARVRAHARIDWREGYEAERARGQQALPWEEIRHVVIITNYKEPIGKLRRTMEALAQQRDISSHIWVVLAMEAREEGAPEKARALQREYRGRLGGVFYTLHPADLPGEIAGKSSNEAWAARWARKYFVDRLGYNIRHITITSCDADSVFHPNYFACLTYKFATDPDRYLRFWQAPILFHNNVWQVPSFIRFVTLSMGVLQLASLANPYDDPFPNSTYSTSFALVDAAGYWDPDVIAEDWHMFLKCFFRRRGKATVEPIYLPVAADAPLSSTLLRTAINRYEQAKRHAWGVSDFPYAIKLYFQHAEIPVHIKLPRVWILAREHLVWSTSWFSIVLGMTIPSLLSPAFATSEHGIILQKFSTMTVVIATVLSPLIPLIDILLRPPRPPDRKWWQTAWSWLQWNFLAVFMLFLVVLPSLEAQTKLMFGEKLTYRVTEKV